MARLSGKLLYPRGGDENAQAEEEDEILPLLGNALEMHPTVSPLVIFPNTASDDTMHGPSGLRGEQALAKAAWGIPSIGPGK